jgi:hypothetical protein
MLHLFQAGKRSLESAGACALIFYLLNGIVILFGVLLVTVHNRSQINLARFTDFSLPGIHNQLLPLLSAAFLGYLSMRLARQLSASTVNAFILGIGVQTAYQTLPNNLWFYWKTHPTSWWIFFMAVFWTLEENPQIKKKSIYWIKAPVLAGMFWVDWVACFFVFL